MLNSKSPAMDALQEQYETVAYPAYVHTSTHPARIGAVARLFGMRPADPRCCRVLELGCNQAANLLALADRMPQSRFLGLDFSGPDIAAGREVQAEAGLTNIELRQQDLLTFEPRGEKFDYVIAHGVFSWVPDAVKERMLALCRECLAPGGVAYISYATYPGEKESEAVRDLLRLRTQGCTTPSEKVASATGALRFLDQALATRTKDPFAASWRATVNRALKKEPNYLLHDDLEAERDPCYLLQFTNWASEHDLQYVADCEFSTMLLENLPTPAAKQLAALQLNRLETEQFIDFLIHRTFRMSLLAHREAAVAFQPDGAPLLDLCLSTSLQLRPNQAGTTDSAQFRSLDGGEFRLRGAPLVALVRELIARAPSIIPFDELLAAARRRAGREFSEAEMARVRADLVSLYGRRLIELHTIPLEIPRRLPERPCLSLFNRALARRWAMLATAFHATVRLSPHMQAICLLLDGTRSVEELRSTTEGRAVGDNWDRMMNELLRSGCIH